MVIAGAALLERNRDAVDALNVFPVPDGDTGTNMSLTMASATRELNSKEFIRADEAAAALAKGALRGARGNSGVITSQLYRGFSKALAGVEKINPTQFAAALQKGAETAYKAVMKPKEGTILTVARVIAENAVNQARRAPNDFDALFNVILTTGDVILNRTREMLPALKQAGVVDAGGKGLLLLYTGYAAVLRGEEITELHAFEAASSDEFKDDHSTITEVKNAYHTSFTIKDLADDVEEEDIHTLRRQMNRVGDRVFVDNTDGVVRVHLHTNDPGKALQYALDLGEMTDLEIINIRWQRKDEERKRIEEERKNEPPKKYGMVSVSLGNGFSNILKELNVDRIVDGGQTMNPSIEDLSNAIDAINAENIFVFPNNGNIILAAQQAAKICKDKKVFVLPTKNVAMGIAGAVAFSEDVEPEENVQNMTEAAERVRTGTITYAVRDSEYENLHIKEGDIIGLSNGQVTLKADNVHDVALSLMDGIVTDDDSLITVYYGAETKPEDAEALAKELGEKYSNCEVQAQEGGQPLYYYLISVE